MLNTGEFKSDKITEQGEFAEQQQASEKGDLDFDWSISAVF